MDVRQGNGWREKEIAELSFRYRTLVAAQRILQEQLEAANHLAHGDGFYLHRLRKLKAYIADSLAGVERAMQGSGMVPPDRRPPPSKRARKLADFENPER